MPRRTLRTVAAAFVLAMGGMGVGSAHADDNASQICKDINAPGISHGACVALAQAGNPTPLISDLCDVPGFQAAVGADNKGQCIKAARALLP